MTPKEAVTIVRSKARGRTRWEGQEPFLDEVLVEEIERLWVILDALAELESLFNGGNYLGIYELPAWKLCKSMNWDWIGIDKSILQGKDE